TTHLLYLDVCPTRRSSDLIRSGGPAAFLVKGLTFGHADLRARHDAFVNLPLRYGARQPEARDESGAAPRGGLDGTNHRWVTSPRSEEHTSELQSSENLVCS